MVEQETINKTLEFMADMSHAEAVANEKIELRKFFRSLTKTGELDSFAMDYTEESFRFSLIKCPEERIFRFNMDGTIQDLGDHDDGDTNDSKHESG